mgnify:CR=1 FL=1
MSLIKFIFYRLFGGLGIGAASVLAPAYIAEVAPAALRGRLATLQQLAIVLGLFAAFLRNYIIASDAGGAEGIFMFDIAAWRWMFWVELIPAVLFLCGVLFIPESPRYLVAQGQIEKAKEMINNNIISGGMIPKINNCLDVASNGVKGVVIIDGRKPHSILFELFSDKGAGTLIRE